MAIEPPSRAPTTPGPKAPGSKAGGPKQAELEIPMEFDAGSRLAAPSGGATVTVIGAGIVGLWVALVLARRRHKVTLIDQSQIPFAAAASRYAGAMLAPFCEAEGAGPLITSIGLQALTLWQRIYPDVTRNGTLVIAPPRDRAELHRFERLTEGHETIDADRLGALEPDLSGRFTSGLFYPSEAHLVPEAAMAFLLDAFATAGGAVQFGAVWHVDDTPSNAAGDAEAVVVDCRGLGARAVLPRLRGVRGERVVMRSREMMLSRPVRLLHPRFPLYVVPWGEGLYMVGATVIESDDPGPMTARSALELLGMAYALHPAFGEADVVEFAAGVRPAFPDNVPRLSIAGRRISVNGMYRHGFLLAPALACLVAEVIEADCAPVANDHPWSHLFTRP